MRKAGTKIPGQWVEWRFCRGEEFWGVCWFEKGRGFKLHSFEGRIGDDRSNHYETFKSLEAVKEHVRELIAEKLKKGFRRTLRTTWTLTGGAQRWKTTKKKRAARERRAFKAGAREEAVSPEQRRKMAGSLRDLLRTLATVCERDGVQDTVSREALTEALFEGFVYQEAGYTLPRNFYMLTSAGNKGVRAALGRYIARASKTAREVGLTTPAQRLAAFKDPSVRPDGRDFEDFFGGLNVNA